MVEETPELPVSPQEVQIQAPTLLDKIKIHKFKILAGILGALVFIGAVFGAYKFGQRQIWPGPQPTPEAVATPTPDPTANWKTYTSQKGGFAIKYPSSWPYVEGKLYEGDKETLEKIHLGTDNPDADNNPDEVIVFLAAYRDSLTFGKTSVEYFQKISDSVDPTTKREITVGGLPAIRAFVKGVYPFSDTVVAGKNGYLYRLELLDTKATNKDKEGNARIFNLMLSTFRFLPSTSSGQGEKIYCKKPRPEVCTMECITNPPYICGSNGKSYCNVCGACADPEVTWYLIQDAPCKP